MSSSDPIQLNYLVFDDEEEEKNQNNLNVKVSGFTCNLIFVNPTDFFIAEDNQFDAEGLKAEIVAKTQGFHISLVATDWNMLPATANHAELNGLEIIETLLRINDKYRKCPFLIYSGKPQEASNVMIEKLRAEICSGEVKEPIYALQLLSLLLELKIKFCARGSRFAEINTLIKGEKSISLIVLNLLANVDRNLLINTGNEYYDGKRIGDLIDMLSKDNDQGFKFVREFIELSIANYTEINE
ncbi:MAG: hypothetical protein ACT6QS_07125 [Flavobacteriales bacterium]